MSFEKYSCQWTFSRMHCSTKPAHAYIMPAPYIARLYGDSFLEEEEVEMKVDSLWDYNPGPLDSLLKSVRILVTTTFTNHTTTWKKFEIF